jgi:N utilization substance protein A
MSIDLSDEARRYLGLFDSETGVGARDCLVDDANDRLVFLIPPGEMGSAIGPDGQTIQAFESLVSRQVELVEDAETAEDFVANALAPAAVYNVTISENRDVVAYAEVAHEDRGVAIGTEGKTIHRARRLAKRHFDIDDVELV